MDYLRFSDGHIEKVLFVRSYMDNEFDVLLYEIFTNNGKYYYRCYSGNQCFYVCLKNSREDGYIYETLRNIEKKEKED